MLQQLKNQCIKDNMNLISEVIEKDFSGYLGNFGDDMFQEGYLALYDAYGYVEVNSHSKEFKEFAVKEIRRTIGSYLKQFGYEDFDTFRNVSEERLITTEAVEGAGRFRELILTTEIPTEPKALERLEDMGESLLTIYVSGRQLNEYWENVDAN